MHVPAAVQKFVPLQVPQLVTDLKRPQLSVPLAAPQLRLRRAQNCWFVSEVQVH